MLVPNFVQNERELLYCRDNDLLAALNELPKVAGMFCMPNGLSDLGELFDCCLYLLIENPTVGDDNDRIEDVLAVLLYTDELVG